MDISSVLEALRNAQVLPMKEAIHERNLERFRTAYSETIVTCNMCHASSGYGFIQVTQPTAPPVTNQSWKQTKEANS
jgi:hypothetical protein